MDAQTCERKLSLLREPRMLPLTEYTDDLARRTNRVIPFFDPEDGGTQAELLLLMSHVDGDPGSARNGSPFISMENEDPTANNLQRVILDLGLPRSTLLLWNVVPWQDGDPKKEAGVGAIHLPRLIQRLPNLRGIAVLSKEGSVVKSVREEVPSRYRLEWTYTFSPGPRGYAHNGARLTQDLQNIARKLSLL
ncbi:hypothetical protein DAERI_150099 [Deinococcus aerius]|uniref:Uracil-DNA glycosylase n=2 Tax=Deinococcus aerius TaxID=200253 RepID=A0A2I9DQM2_9DEIO|nr:hypothetical protein DAERI_150099 [Deinococcus aerius]